VSEQAHAVWPGLTRWWSLTTTMLRSACGHAQARSISLAVPVPQCCPTKRAYPPFAFASRIVDSSSAEHCMTSDRTHKGICMDFFGSGNLGAVSLRSTLRLSALRHMRLPAQRTRPYALRGCCRPASFCTVKFTGHWLCVQHGQPYPLGARCRRTRRIRGAGRRGRGHHAAGHVRRAPGRHGAHLRRAVGADADAEHV